MARRQRVYVAALQLVRARALKRMVPRLEMGRSVTHGGQKRIEGEGRGEGEGGKGISTVIRYSLYACLTSRLLCDYPFISRPDFVPPLSRSTVRTNVLSMRASMMPSYCRADKSLLLCDGSALCVRDLAGDRDTLLPSAVSSPAFPLVRIEWYPNGILIFLSLCSSYTILFLLSPIHM